MSPEQAPTSSQNSKFQPSVPDLGEEAMPETQATSEPTNIVDIEAARETRETKRGRPPAGEPRRLDIAARKREIGDIIDVDENGRGRDPEGRFVSEANMGAIEDRADFIRQNTPGSPNNNPQPETVDTTDETAASEQEPVVSQQPGPEQTQAETDSDIYQEYSDAVRSGGAKDKTFREWISENEGRKAARWWSATRPHGEAYIATEVQGPDTEEKGSGDIDPKLLMDQEHQDRLIAREGKPTPTEDDLRYYANRKEAAEQDGEQPTPELEPPAPITEPTPAEEPDNPEPQEPAPTPPAEQPIEQPPVDPNSPALPPVETIGPDNPPPPEEQGGPPNGPEEPGIAERLSESSQRLDLAIERFARARVNSERMFGGKNDPELVDASTELQRAYQDFCGVLAERAAMRVAEEQARLDSITRERLMYEGMAASAQEQLSALEPDDPQVQVLLGNINALEQRQAELATREAASQAEIARVQAESEQEIAQNLVRVQTNVDALMIREEERTRPALGKIANWLRKHPKTRIVAGVALAGLGIFGTVTGNVPLVVGAIAARASLAGIGGYNASRGVGEMIAGRRYGQADTSTIEGYTDAAQQQSRTRRRSKKTGAVVGAGLAAIPIVRGIGQLQDMVQGAPKPPPPDVTPNKPAPPDLTPQAPPTPSHPDLAFTDGRYPWTHMTERIGSNGTPRILDIAQNAPSMGWQVVGNGQGGGAGAILRVVAPDGYVYQGNAAINAALDHLDKIIPR